MPRSLDPNNYPPVFIKLVERVAAGNKVEVDFATLADSKKFIRDFTAGFINSLTKMQQRIDDRRGKDVTEMEQRWMEVLLAARGVCWQPAVPSSRKPEAWTMVFMSKEDTPIAQALAEGLSRDGEGPEAPKPAVISHPRTKSQFDEMLERLLKVQHEVDGKEPSKDG